MWKSGEYCDFNFNWSSNHDLGYLVSYSFVQDTDNEESSVQELLPSSPMLECNTTEGPALPPELRITCKPHNSVNILNIDIISDARVVEVFSDIDGYLMSCKGEIIADPRSEDADQQRKLYKCRIHLEEPLTRLSIKFVGLGERTSFTIDQLHISLVQSMAHQPGHSDSSIDYTKVRSYLHSMGDAIPDSARELLDSVEQFQKTQMLGLSSIQAALSGSRSQKGQDGGLGLIAGLLSKMSTADIASKFSQDSRTNGIKTEPNSNETIDNPRESDIHLQTDNIDSSVDSTKSLSPLDRLLRKTLTPECEGQITKSGDSQGQGDMYKMLQGICGSVSAIRQKSQQVDMETEQSTTSEDGAKKQTETSVVTETAEQPDLDKVIEQTVSQEFEKCEQRLKEYVDTSLVAMETRMNSKLDKMLELLSKSSDS